MAKYEGMNGLYRYNCEPLYLMMYEQFKYLFARRLYAYGNNDITPQKMNEMSSWYIGISACTAGAIAAVVTNPLDMVKLRMQVQRGGIYNFGYRNIFDGIYKLIKYEHITSLFHGSGARVAFWVPNVAVNI